MSRSLCGDECENVSHVLYIFKNEQKSWDAAAKKSRYKCNRDKYYEEIYIVKSIDDNCGVELIGVACGCG